MRNAFAAELTALAAQDPRLVLLAGDIGNRLFDRLKDHCPDRFYNCGVAEANMIGLAAGLALGGLRPVAYTITPFITTRCLEQIRLDLCYQRLPVVLVGTGAGLSYAALNASHHSCEDLAMLRVLPNMTVLCPGDPVEVRLALRAAFQHDGPVYLRLGKKGEPVVHEQLSELVIGHWLPLRPPGVVTVLSTGNVLPLALQVGDVLAARHIACGVVSCHTVKPLDTETLGGVFAQSRLVVTLEEHSILGGFGGAVAEWLSEQRGPQARLLRQGTADAFLYEAGEQAHARQRYGLTTDAIVEQIERGLEAA